MNKGGHEINGRISRLLFVALFLGQMSLALSGQEAKTTAVSCVPGDSKDKEFEIAVKMNRGQVWILVPGADYWPIGSDNIESYLRKLGVKEVALKVDDDLSLGNLRKLAIYFSKCGIEKVNVRSLRIEFNNLRRIQGKAK